MALLAMRPSLVEMIDLLGFGPDIRLEEVSVHPGSRLDGLTIADALARYSGASVLAVKQPGADLSVGPDQATRLGPGDLIVCVGPNAILDRMSE